MKSNNVKRIILSIVMILVMLCGIAQSVVYAADGTTQSTLTAMITKWRYKKDDSGEFVSTGYGYRLSSDHKIFQILELNNATDREKIGKSIYCLNATSGETWRAAENEESKTTYNTHVNLKENKDAIKSTLGITDDESYYAILWLLDNFYMPNSETTADAQAKAKDDFLKNIGIYKDERDTVEVNGKVYPAYMYHGKENFALIGTTGGYKYVDEEGNPPQDVLIPDELIESVQQSAIWYFTNYKNNKPVDTEGNEKDDFNAYTIVGEPDKDGYLPNTLSWLYCNTTDMNNTDKDSEGYGVLSQYNKAGNTEKNTVGEVYQEQASILYNYLVDKAQEEGKKGYKSASITIDDDKSKVENNKIGPFKYTATGMVSDVTVEAFNGDTKIDGITTEPATIAPGEDFYVVLPSGATSSEDVKIQLSGKVKTKTATLWTGTHANGKPEQPIVKIEDGEVTVDANASVKREFDLALRKVITGVKKSDGTVVKTVNENGYDATRTINIDDTIPKTATYKHRKDPVVVEEGYKVTYNLNIYNEGDIDGYASKVEDQLPTGLVSTLKVGDELTPSLKGNVYVVESYNDNKLVLKISDKKTPTMLNAHTTKGTIDKDTISLECTVTQKADAKKHYLTNIAYISEARDSKDKVEQDGHEGSKPSRIPSHTADQLNAENPAYTGGRKDSIFTSGTNNDVYFWGQEDDDDFETLVLLPKQFDLKLVKYISAINGVKSNREITVDSSKLNKTVNGKKVTTADYDVSKVPLTVKTGDFVTYTFRIYNEADVDGYATEISEDIPEGLEFVYSTHGTDAEIDADTNLTDKEKAAIKFNRNYYWKYDPDDTSKKTIVSDYLAERSEKTPGDNLIKAFDSSKDKGNGEGLSYKELSVMFKVTSTDVSKIIRNEAAITEDSGDDRDSETEQWKKEDSNDYYEDNKDYPKYKEDDEDYDNIKLARFDLALRKFITAISNDATISDGEYLSADKTDKTEYTRAPKVDSSKLKSGKETTAIYNHSKDPITVNGGDYVLYTIRVYNEGDLDGYAAEIKDYLPEYLNFVSGEFNTKYGWEYNANDRTISTKYLSSANGATNLLKAFDAVKDNGKGSGLSYKDVPILCRVSSKAVADKNITNIAEITVYQDENGNNKDKDVDSTPSNLKYPEDPSKYEGNKDGKNASDKYYPGQEDDDDFDRVKVENLEFDLSLLKYVSEVKVTENGTTTTTKTGNKGDKNDIIPKVEIHRKHMKSTTVKFIFTIKITNEGDIAGYAKEITDYIPSGLEFYNEDNKGWTKKGNKVTTTLLADKLLEPGESATVKITFRWKKSESNLGLKTNVAEISKDYNEKGVPDRDSTPGNKKNGEDDIDDAQVLLSIKTGITDNIIAYVSGAAVILLVIAGGVILIKKFVL
ncbi:MAG: hypothetical protein HFJ17_05060 [Clostridia bacterium]|nr:hypothetical protein [Clostridia bacterium]